MKSGKAKVRVVALGDVPDDVMTRVLDTVVKALDAGTYDGPKNVRL